ncbi:HAD family hydrolase [Vallitalea pronyensis]|uniref:HAD family hydrolase n=1 Tax=Vallitalea pronyensis TaxID=1348613 RepID=A0A8J8SI86_9FIRM|nr:HAD family hydrolase [Vallitalea pronyensis]QUI24194.1 HAD family hydrolase [Vallitalea pronyensis]
MMDIPKMIIFDYGQTLVDEKPYDILKGTEAVLLHAVENPDNVSAEEICVLSTKLFGEIVKHRDLSVLEAHNHSFQNYLYDYFGIVFTISSLEIERIFEGAASTGEPTKNIGGFLQLLSRKGIRTGVISNMSFSGSMLTERINRYMPSHAFEFIISSSEYVFRKPHKRIFELALRKAKLEPHHVWYCGDHAICDIDGAANCGIFPIWYKGAFEEKNTHVPTISDYLEVNDWHELITLIEKNK